jgi:pimeloyl-ACP methyl ester carboxylesterase
MLSLHDTRSVRGRRPATARSSKLPHQAPLQANDTAIHGNEHWTTVGGERLFLWQKGPVAGASRGTVLLVHGSSMGSQASFDVEAPGVADSSLMNWLALRGFEVWCYDSRGYGRSGRPDGFLATIADGADDLAAASAYIEASTRAGPLLVYGVSSGALRAGLFAERHPERVKRLILDALVWTGKDSPTLAQRRKHLPEFLAHPRRPLNAAFLQSIFSRDRAETVRTEMIQPFIEAVLALEDSVPNGTYIDMCQNLPILDPAKIDVPTLIMRGEHDGIASFDDVWSFFRLLRNADKEFAVMPGVSHASLMNKNYARVYDLIYTFFSRPELAFRG